MERIEKALNEIMKEEKIVDVSIRRFDNNGKLLYKETENLTMEYQRFINRLSEVLKGLEVVEVKYSNYCCGWVKIACKDDTKLTVIRIEQF